MTVETRENPADTLLETRTIHAYPRDPRYRRSGSIPIPQPGDIAYCGFVKDTPARVLPPGTGPTCLMCLRLRSLAEPWR